MSQSYVANFQHIVFGTKDRRPLLPTDELARIWAYLGGTARNIGCTPLAIGGIEDHVHALITIPADANVAHIVSKLKANSSRWMNEWKGGFAWQRGYASFSVSASNLASVTRYIANQREHHRKRSFEEEFEALLRKHGLRLEDGRVLD